MKKLIAALSLLFVLSLTACGNSDAALRQENEALRQQISALEAERDNLTKENKDLTEENAALDDTAQNPGTMRPIPSTASLKVWMSVPPRQR